MNHPAIKTKFPVRLSSASPRGLNKDDAGEVNVGEVIRAKDAKIGSAALAGLIEAEIPRRARAYGLTPQAYRRYWLKWV